MKLLSLLAKRGLHAVPVLIGVSIGTFCLLNLLPGNAAIAILGTQATASQIKALDRELNLSQPLMIRYWHWLTGVLHGSFGNSLLTQEPVSHLLLSHAPVTVEMVSLAFLVALALAIPVALFAARKPNHVFDRITSVISMVGLSIPGYVLALILSLILAVHLKWLPAVGYVPLGTNPIENLRSLVLPVLTISFSLFATYVRLLRADLVDQMTTRDYILGGRAKGLSQWAVLLRHALRNASLGLVTVVSVNMGTLLGATVVVESIFGLPGLGQQLIQAIDNRDAPIVQGTVLLMAVAVVAANLFADVCYTFLDPRIRYSRNEV